MVEPTASARSNIKVSLKKGSDCVGLATEFTLTGSASLSAFMMIPYFQWANNRNVCKNRAIVALTGLNSARAVILSSQSLFPATSAGQGNSGR
jgi:hypothetical protein